MKRFGHVKRQDNTIMLTNMVVHRKSLNERVIVNITKDMKE